MKFIKKTEISGEYTKVYFVDEAGMKQGVCECYLTNGSVLPREDNLCYRETFKDNISLGKEFSLYSLRTAFAYENQMSVVI